MTAALTTPAAPAAARAPASGAGWPGCTARP